MHNAGRVLAALLTAGVLVSCASGAREAPAPDSLRDRAFSSEAAFGDSVSAARDAAETEMIAYTVTVRLDVKKVEESLRTVLGEVKTHGGFVVQESSSRYSEVTARIPAENVEPFVGRLGVLGRVSHLRRAGVDIGRQYRDDLTRLENLKTVRDRYLALLEQAVNVTEILGIERELERVNTEIELLEGKKNYAELRVSYSQVSVQIRERTAPGPLGWIFYGLYAGVKWLFVW
jgi:hypothetical protein